MDEKGFISIEYIFSIFIILIIALGLLFYTSTAIMTQNSIEDSITHRLIIEKVADSISQVNSNGEGYSKQIYLDSKNGYYELTLEKDKITIEYDSRKGESKMTLLNLDSKYKLHSGQSYYITKNDEGKIVIT